MKFAPFFHGNAVYKITQTYHGVRADFPPDLSWHCAVDWSALGGANCYAVADGVIVGASAADGGYCYLDIGEPYYIYYVHTDNWLPKGTRVSRGQKICQIKSMAGSHLHLALRNKNGKAPHPQLMDYVDRSVKYVSGHPEITAVWFKNGDPNVINWNKFNDYQIGMSLAIGNRVEFTKDTNLRHDPTKPGVIDAVIKAGAVGTLIGGPRQYPIDGTTYTFWDTKFNDEQGWVFQNNMVATTKSQTGYGGVVVPPPDPCEEKIKVAVASTSASYQKIIDSKDEEIKKLKAANVLLLADKVEVEKKLSSTETELRLCTERNEKLEKDIQEYIKLLKEANDRILVLEKKNSELSRKITSLQEELAECEKGNNSGCLPFSKFFRNRNETLPLSMEEKSDA